MFFTSLTDFTRWEPQNPEYVLALPSALGEVTSLNIRHGKLVATTESGISMIVHKPRQTP